MAIPANDDKIAAKGSFNSNTIVFEFKTSILFTGDTLLAKGEAISLF